MATPERIVEWLEEHDALQLGGSPWRTVAPDEDVFLIDWRRLFPSERPGDTGQNDWDVFGDEWDFGQEPVADDDAGEFVARIRDALESQRPSEQEGHDIAEGLGWDTCAWYQPMHFFGHDWGIFIRRDCIRENAILVARFLPKGTLFSLTLLKALIRAGFSALFLHEQFHHKIESLGIRLHVVERTCRYMPYEKSVYRPSYGTDDNLEEALANADAFLRTKTAPYSLWMGKTVVAALQAYLKWRFPFDPPGYRKASNYLTTQRLDNGVDFLHGQVQEALLNPKRAFEEWEIATRLHQSLFKVTDHLWEVVPSGYPHPILPGAAPYPSISTLQLLKLAESHGWSVKDGAGKGSHIRMERPNSASITIPANRRDLSPGVIKTALKAFGDYKLNDLGWLLHRKLGGS
jgi:predicted RNA binding protein YcfA (HicA-like mRNA interferase family)